MSASGAMKGEYSMKCKSCRAEAMPNSDRCSRHLEYARLWMRAHYKPHNDGRRCGVCGETGHNRQTCKVLMRGKAGWF